MKSLIELMVREGVTTEVVGGDIVAAGNVRDVEVVFGELFSPASLLG